MLFHEVKLKAYKLHRAASQGANITLVTGCDEYVATYECATKIAAVLGKEGLRDLADGIYESIPSYHISFENMHNACSKLAQHFSIALVDCAQDKHGSRYFLIWRIPHAHSTSNKPVINLDEF